MARLFRHHRRPRYEHQNTGALAATNRGGDPLPAFGRPRPGDDGIEFSPDGKRILFTEQPRRLQQIWLAHFESVTGATSNAIRPDQSTSSSAHPWLHRADNAKWSPDAKSIVFTADVYPDCPPITASDAKTGDTCNADRDKAKADSKVKAQIFTHLMYRHWNHFTGDKRTHLFLIDVASGAVRDLVPNRSARRSHRLSDRPAADVAAPSRPTRRNWPSPGRTSPTKPSAPTPTSSPSTSPTHQRSR